MTTQQAGAKAEGASGGLAISPPRDAFSATYSAGDAQVVWTRLVADLETPVSAYLKLSSAGALGGNASGQSAMSFLLESVEGGATRGRYSVIGLQPDLVWRAFGEKAEINRAPLADAATFEPEAAPTLDALRALLSESHIAIPEDLPPMVAGVFGHMGYDMVRLVERLPDVPPDDLGVPDALLMRPTLMTIVISSFTVSNIAIRVGRISSASG
ncbi:MAG: hypothetical protein AAFO62_13560, partial [Pseudomonadota bacterium]